MSEHLLFEDELLEAVRGARPDLPGAALSPAGPEAQAVLERVLAGRPRGRRPRARRGLRRALGGAPVALAIGAVVVVVAVAVLTLRGHAPGTSGGGAGSGGVRGEIVAAGAQVLARSDGFVTYFYFDQSKLPRAGSARRTALERLARAVNLDRPAPPAHLPMTVIPPSGSMISASAATYLSRHRSEFPEVRLVRAPRRLYPPPPVATQPVGTVANHSGLEGYYNAELSRGDTLETSLDLGLERAGERALQQAIEENPPARGGAFVALDPQNGQVYAMGSDPTYNPNVFELVSPGAVDRTLTNPRSGFPLINRATQSAGPVGSAFAPITALAALESGAWSVGDRFDDTGQYCFEGQCWHNSGRAVDGVLDLEDALKVSSNDFFYNLGALTNSSASHAGALQHWARLLGVGSPTGVDLPGEASGTLPTPAGRARRNEAWSAGDNINLAAGQGDVQVTPLQLAVAYAAIANGGTVVRPHLATAVQRPDGSVVRSIDPPPVRHLNINPVYLDAVRVGLRAAASQPGGTSADVFRGFPEQLYGETGTAQYNREQDYAWYAGFVPASATSKPIVVVVWVQQGGFGAIAAAPVARQILSRWFFGRPGPWVVGTSQTL